MEEEKIMRLLEKEDYRSAFNLIVKTYQKKIYWHIRRMVYSHDDADDIVQDTFIKVYQNLSSFHGNSKVYSWIYRIATNESINWINKKARQNNISFEDVSYQMAESLESDVFFNGEQAELQLQKAIAILPEKQRMVFQMKYYEELKYEEIADILGTSVGALKASYHHAVKKIENYITAYK